MRRMFKMAFLVAGITSAAFSQIMTITGVVNGAGFKPDPNHIAAPYSIITIFGTNFTSSPSAASTVPLPSTLGGVTVYFNGVPAPLYYVGPTQINVQMLATTAAPGSILPMQITAAGRGTATTNVTVVADDPTCFQPNCDLQFVGPDGVVRFNTIGIVALPRDNNSYYFTMWMTGLGAPDTFNPSALPGLPSPALPPVTKMGNYKTTVILGDEQLPDGSDFYKGASPAEIGVDQVNVHIDVAAVARQVQKHGRQLPLQILYQDGVTTKFFAIATLYF